jgi:MFS family permease
VLRLSPLLGLLAPLPLSAAWIAASLLEEGYSARREDISGLAARTAGHAWIVTAGLLLSGLATALFAPLLRRYGSQAGPASILVACVGVGMIGLAGLRNDCSTLTEICRARARAGQVSWQHRAHDALSAPVIGAAVLAPAALAWALRRRPGRARLAGYSLATAAVAGVSFALGGAEALPGWEGVLQRIGVSVSSAWLEVVALGLLRAPPGGS